MTTKKEIMEELEEIRKRQDNSDKQLHTERLDNMIEEYLEEKEDGKQ